MLIHGDCLEKLKRILPNSIDAIVTDPPYGLSFMGKKWDYNVPSVEIWKEALRVLKPGGHLLSFAGTRTYHRMAVNIEDAGFEIRDQIMWIYGSGFPKSHDVSKGIDKAAGAEREVIGKGRSGSKESREATGILCADNFGGDYSITSPSTDSAKQWQGWGTALKPANEPIVVARKPLEKGLTVAQNVLKYGCGALNIDASRIETSDNLNGGTYSKGATQERVSQVPGNGINREYVQPQGRWPANVLFDEEAAQVLDEQSGAVRSAGAKSKTTQTNSTTDLKFMGKAIGIPGVNNYADSGGASRFFYVAKSSKKERNAGLEGMPQKLGGAISGRETRPDRPPNHTMRENFHPTVKPLKLMEYLIKLVTPPNGTVLDPFMGSGSTGVAAKNLGFNFIGIERELEYFEIAKKRIENG